MKNIDYLGFIYFVVIQEYFSWKYENSAYIIIVIYIL